MLIATACVSSKDDLQSRNPDYLSGLCSTYSASKEDEKAVEACHALEQLVGENEPSADLLMRAKAKGKILSPEEFRRVFDFVSSTQLATGAMARAYYRLGVRENGRKYAVQAVGWSLVDAKDTHDLLIMLRRLADKSEFEKRRQDLQARLVTDQNVAPDMERLYPRVVDEAASRMHLTRANFDRIVEACVRFEPDCGDSK